MALKVRLKFDGHCPKHPRYSPERDGAPPRVKGYDCAGCDDLYVIYHYSKVVARKVQYNNNLTLDKVGVIIPGYVSGSGAIKPQQIVFEKDIEATEKAIKADQAEIKLPIKIDAVEPESKHKEVQNIANAVITTKGAVERVRNRKKGTR